MKVLKIIVKLPPGRNVLAKTGADGKKPWYSAWVLSYDGLIVETSPSAKHWMAKRVDDFTDTFDKLGASSSSRYVEWSPSK